VSSKYKSEFIANMSHELRTPLNSLLILAQQLEDNPDNNMTDTQVEYASVIRSSGTDLLELLNSILDLAKAESGTVTVEMAELPIDQLQTTLLREFEHVAQQKSLGYSIDIDPDSPVSIVTDPQRLAQILKNLLSNAFKFTEQGNVQLHIGVAEDGWSRDTEALNAAESVLAISVGDTGIGIAEEQQQRIFEAFAQGDGTTARLYGGTGLGLSISRELVGLLGGEITVVSTQGQGSTFTVYLPVSQPAHTAPITADAAPVAAHAMKAGIGDSHPSPASASPLLPDGGNVVVPVSAPAQPRGNGAGKVPGLRSDRRRSDLVHDNAFIGSKVLVVDDDYRNVFAMTALLERGSAEVIAAESGADAIAILEGMPDIDVVLMDIMMPGMDGYATMRAIRALDRFKTLPVIAVTGKVMSGERQRCIDAGASDYVPKPVDTNELLAVIGPWLRGSAVMNEATLAGARAATLEAR
jgi:hypothetical protein